MDEFNFSLGDVVLAEWEDKLFYAKIQKIDNHDQKCVLIFDDDSVEECPFARIHSVTETTAEIVCIICKDGSSSRPNEIVLCDKCGIGYHQSCHEPNIPASALEFDAPWMCLYCTVGEVCPYLTNPFEAPSSKKSSKKRRLETVRGENCLSSGYSTEEEGANPKPDKDPVLPDMSGFYYPTQQHHRDGPKPRGRPPFSHKAAKSLSERRGRSVGRAPGRSSTLRYRDLHEEHRYDPVRKSHSQHYRHGEMPRQGRYGSPNRISKRSEEIETEKVSTAPKNCPSKTSLINEESSAVATLAKMQRRDTPREKQRLTQDLARQKRLLSEDIARAELLHREQLSKKLDKNEKKDQTQELEDLNDLSREDLQILSHIHEDTRADKMKTMYEKVYGCLSPDSSDRAQFDEMLTEEPKKDKNLNYDQERKSLFERYKIAKDVVEEMKNIEFVNEAKVEVRGTSCCSQENVNGVVDTNVTPKLEPLKFENVTDDELIHSDNDTSENQVNCLTFGAVNGEFVDHSVTSNQDSGNMLDLLDEPRVSPSERTNNSESDSEIFANSYSADLNQETNFEKIDSVNCECVNSEMEEEGSNFSVNNSDKSCNSESDNMPDHSNIKGASKLEQLLEEPDMQCEHSSKNCDETKEVNSDQYQENGTESDTSGNFIEATGNSGAQLENNADNAKLSEVTEAENYISSRTAESNHIATPTQRIEPVKNEENTTESRPGDMDTDLSNNEGMSDAEELSDSDIHTTPQRGKVKKRKKRKQKKSKTHTNSSLKFSNTSFSLKGRSKGGRIGGRGKKSNRKLKPIQESDSDDAFSYLASPKTRDEPTARDGEREDEIHYQGPMVKEDSSSDPPPVLFEDSADINETFDATEDNCGSSKRESDKQSAIEENIILMDKEKNENENVAESDKNCQTAEGIASTKNDQHDSVGEADNNGQEIFSLTTAERQMFEEQERKEKVRKEKRFAARQKRRNEEQKENERSTPPHLVSQNRFARDLPRHNWLVERLLQQKQLCEDTLNEESTTVNDGQGERGSEDFNSITKDNNDRNELSEGKDGSPKLPQERQSEGGDSSDEDSSSAKDEFQSELHRSFLRRRYPSNVPCGPPKLKPATPDNSKNSGSGPPPLNSLKHKLLSPKEYPTMEPIPKLRKISDDYDKSDSSADTIKIEPHLDLDAIQPQNADIEKLEEPNSNENEPGENNITPIEVLNSDDEKERKNDCSELKEYAGVAPFREEENTENKSSKTDSNENLSLPTGRESFNFSTPKKPIAQKMVNSVSPTVLSTKPKEMQNSKDKLSPSMHVSPHHRAAILIPLMPMHEGGLPIPPSLGPPSPHMKGYPPRTFAPHLISHSSSAIQPPGLFQSQHSPSGRYSGNACMHHMHGGLKSGIPCKRDINCPFHGSTPRGVTHSGILGIPSHHTPIPAFSQHSHISEHIPPIFAGEHREGEKNPCTHPDCKPCHAGKESPGSKYKESELGSSAKISPQIPKVVKPIAHVPGKRPPLMLSHLQQPLHPSRHPPNIEGYHSEKDRQPPSGLDSLLPGNRQKSPDKSVRDRITPGFHHLSDKRPFNHPLTLSELNRRREEEEILKTRIGEHGPEHRHRPGDFTLPRLSSPPRLSSKSSGIFSTRDSSALLPNRSPPLKEAEMLRRFGKERERPLFLPEQLKTGPPRLRSVDDTRDLADLRLIADRQKREDVALRDNVFSKESQAMFRQMRSKDAASPEAKLFTEKSAAEQAKEDSHGRVLEHPPSRLHPTHGNTGVFSLANPAHSLGELHKNIDEARKSIVREEQQGFQDLNKPELGASHRNYRPGDKNVGIHELERRQRVDMHSNEPDKKELVDKERQNRSPSTERERQGERLSDRDKSPFRIPNISPPTLRKDVFGDRMLAMDPRGRPHHRLVPRGVSLQELEIHRRREDLRGVEPSHRELLSRMAMSSRNAVPQLLHPLTERKEGMFESSEHLRIPLALRRGSPPRGISRDFPPTSSSRLAVERLAAAAAQAKPGLVLNEKSKDVPPHLREEIERERERERHRLSLEQLEANRRLLHQELKDKMNPLVFRSDGQPRSRERGRELEVLRTREKLMLERERFYAMERLAEERKRKLSGEAEFHLGMPGRRVSPPNARLSVDREEYERRKRLKLSMSSPSPTSGISTKLVHPQVSVNRTIPGNEASRKDEGPPRSSSKCHGSNLTQLKEEQKNEDPADSRMNRSRDLEILLGRDHRGASIHNGPSVPGGPFFDSRESVWLRERAIRLSQKEMNHKRPLNLSGGNSVFMPPKGGISLPRSHNEPGRTGKNGDDGSNSCSVCKREASFLCSGCQSSWYCSPECQLSAWGAHSRSCGQNQRP